MPSAEDPQSALVGRELRDMPTRGECLVLLVRHAEEVAFEVPHGEYEICSGDNVVFIARTDNKKLPMMFGGTMRGA